MQKLFFVFIMSCLLISIKGSSQSSTQPTISNYVYHPPSTDKKSWQRLNLLLSTWYYKTSTEGIGSDSCLLYVSRSLGMSRLPVTADGIDDPELLAQSQWFDQRNPARGVQLLSQAKGKKHLELLLLLGAYYAYQPRNYNLYKDSVEHYLNKVIDESKAVNEKRLRWMALCLLGKLYVFAPDPAKNKAFFDQAIAESGAAKDKQAEALAYFYRGLYTPLTPLHAKMTVADRLQERIDCFNKAAKLYHELNDTEGEIISLVNEGYFNLALTRFDETYTIFLKALELENAIGFPYTHYTTDNITMLTTAQGKFGEPLKYSLETVKTAEAVRDSIGWGTFYDRLAVLYYTEGHRQDESLKWLYKSLDRFILTRDPNVYSSLYNISTILIEKGREQEALDLAISVSKKIPPVDSLTKILYNISFANCYIGLKQYKLAEQYALAADSIQRTAKHDDLNSAYGETVVLNALSSVYFASGQFAKAKKYIDLILADSSRLIVLPDNIIYYKQLLQIDSVFNDAPSAVKHYKQYILLLDSNFRASKVRQAEEFQVMYQTKEKQDSITLLNKQTTIEKASLKQATLARNVTIAGIIAVLIIAALLYRQSRLRKMNNEVVTHKNELLEHLLTEKEWLLKEIHHRVKNNLQIVMSLLNSQSAYIENDAALTAIHDSQHRVHAMSLIHQKLYNTENLSSIDMSSYIHELVSYLCDSFNTRQRIRFEYNIEPLELDVSQAVPLGLILNEAITNSLKYAFPGDQEGIINISLLNTSSNNYLLSISDNGIGLPAHFTGKKPGSLGMSLMTGLSEDLDGNFAIENQHGTTIKISFLHDQGIKRPDVLVSSFVRSNQEQVHE
jgi:two-component sensor histidine kinase